MYWRPAFNHFHLIFYAFDDHFLLCACIMASQPADLHRLQYEKASVVRRHHIYKSLWTPEVNEILLLRRETGNEHDEYAVAVLHSGYSGLPFSLLQFSA